GQRSAVSGQRSAVSGQRSAVSGQRSAVSGQRSTNSLKPIRLSSPFRKGGPRGIPPATPIHRHSRGKHEHHQRHHSDRRRYRRARL
ncbi:MAG TPA: hypothetical protein EYM54_05890, partial [Dehalococcoidia bacterium]|nr:hypothetical protein [Dehalococcoidia bacterium]